MTRRRTWCAMLAAGAIAAGLAVPGQAAADPSPKPPSESHLLRPGVHASAGKLGPQIVSPSGSWNWQNPQPDGNALFAISCPSASVCYAVGLKGPILKTTDGGITWTQQALASFMNGISCFDITHCVAVGDNGIVIATSNGGTAWSQATINGGKFLVGVSCPSLTECFAVGESGSILVTTNGGSAWAPQSSGITLDHLFAINCPSTTACLAVGTTGTALVTTNGGSTWTATSTGTTKAIFGVSCPTTSSCLAVGQGGVLLSTSFFGSVWFVSDIGSTVTLIGVSCPSPALCWMTGVDGSVYAQRPTSMGGVAGRASTGESGVLYGLSCPAVGTCFAVGDYGMIVVTHNGGTGWSLQPSAASNIPYGISCPSTTVCFLVGRMGLVADTTNGGTTWSQQTSGTAQHLISISCPSTSSCFAVGQFGALIGTINGGATWVSQNSHTTANLRSVSCVFSTRVCFAVTEVDTFIKTTDGVIWTAASAGAGLRLTGISCPTTTTCFATDAENTGATNIIYVTTDGGTNWRLSFNLALDPQAGITAPFQAIACPNTSTCYAVGSSGLIAATSDGGANWRTDNSNSNAGLTGVSCPSVSTCYVSALDSSIFHTTDFGGTWEAQMGFNLNSSISCPSTTVCFAVGGYYDATATTTGGAAWSRLRPTGTVNDIQGLSCFGFSNCYATAQGSLLSSHDGGNTWAEHALGTTDLLDAISCPTANTCFAVGWPAAIYFTGDSGTTWTRQASSLYGSDTTFLGVSCSTTTNCVLVGLGGIVLSTINGTTWSSESSGTTSTLTAVSCPRPPQPRPVTCIAVGLGGLALTRSAGTWATDSTGTTQNLLGVSCPDVSVCYAAGTGGTILLTSNGGASWSTQTSGTTDNLFAISCASRTQCLAAGNFGVAVMTLDGTNWTSVADPNPNRVRAVVFQSLAHAWLAGLGGSILSVPGCTSATLTSDKVSPQSGGSIVTFTATAAGVGCLSPVFQFWMWTPATGWVSRQAYSSNSHFILDTTGMAPGTYTVDAWAEQSGSNVGTSNYETFGLEAWVVGGCDSATLTPNPATATGTVVFTATAIGIGCGTPQYQFYLWAAATGWVLKQAFSSTATWSLDTTTLGAGTYTIDVWVKQQGSPSTYETWALSSLQKGACGSTTITPTQASPQSVGGIINLTTVAAGCTAPQYKYWLYPGTGGTWQLLRDYGAGTFDWNTAGMKPGTYSLDVHVRQGGSTAAYDTFGLLSYSVTGASSATLTASPTSPQALGTPITLTAHAPGSAPQYQFWIYAPGGPWRMVQDFSSTATLNWTTLGLAKGTYSWVVYVRQTGSGNPYDSYALRADTLI